MIKLSSGRRYSFSGRRDATRFVFRCHPFSHEERIIIYWFLFYRLFLIKICAYQFSFYWKGSVLFFFPENKETRVYSSIEWKE